MNYTKQQHYLSKYIIERFTNNEDMIDAVYVPILKKICKCSTDICTKNNFYEDENIFGEFINRNRTENMFSTKESLASTAINDLFEILNSVDSNKKLRNMYTSGDFDYLSLQLMVHLTLIMIRTPQFKSLFDNRKKPKAITQLLYKQAVSGKEEARILASELYQDDTLNEILKYLESSNTPNMFEKLLNVLISNYFIEIYKAPIGKKFFLSDNPVIVKKYDDIDYFIPLSSDTALAF